MSDVIEVKEDGTRGSRFYWKNGKLVQRYKKSKKKTECLFPTETDLDYLEKSIQRHTGGIKEWWNNFTQHKGKEAFRELARAIIIQWEAGRSKAGIDTTLGRPKNPRAKLHWHGVKVKLVKESDW